MSSRFIASALVSILSVTGFGAETKWAPSVSDDFRTSMTFAEEWRTETAKQVKSEGGQLVFSGKGSVRRVDAAPGVCRISAMFAVKSGTAGIRCGKAQVVAKAGESKRLTLDCPKGDFAGKPMELFADGEATVDDFLVEVPVRDDASPNLMVNSGFERTEDGSAPFFQYSGKFKWGERPASEYETRFLKRFRVVEDERHSGSRSLRMWLNPACREIRLIEYHRSTGGPLVARPKVEGGINVFSAWLKASVPGVVVELAYGEKKRVELTTDWRRYEVSTTNKAGHCEILAVGDYAKEATVWIDDLQKETIVPPAGAVYDPARSYATAYRVCDADESLFARTSGIEPPPTIAVPKLPAGVKPSVDYGAWSKSAASVGRFWVGATKKPNKRTEGCVACDDDNLYFGWRNHGEDPEGPARPRAEGAGHDVKHIYGKDSVEFFLRMDGQKPFYHLMGAPNGDRYDRYEDKETWDGEWSVAARVADGAVEYLMTIPFKTLAPQGFAGTFFANVCRNDSRDWSMRECIATTRLNWRETEGWGAYTLPDDVAAKWTAEAKKFAKDDEAAAKGPEVMSRLDYYMDEPVAHFRIWDEQGVRHVAELDISKLPCGTNAVKVTADGRTYETTLVKLPYRENAVQVNRFARCVERHGRKILFSGPCLILRWLARDHGGLMPKIRMVHDAGFRQLHVAGFGTREELELTAGLFDWGATNDVDFLHWSQLEWDPAKLAKNKKTASPEEYFRGTDRPNVLSQMVLDEPELGQTSDWSRDYLRKCKRYFPYTPVQMNNTIFGVPNRFAGLETDILMLDNYLTASRGARPCDIHKHVDAMRLADRGKPYWLFLVSDNTSLHYKTPSYGEQIAQSWGSICWGATGISWYLGLPSVEATWRAMVDANREIQSLKDEILSEEECAPASTPLPQKDLAILTRRTGDTLHVFTCNMTDVACKKVKVTLGADAPREGTVEVLFENRTLPLHEGSFTDDYAPYARHIYRLRRPLKVLMIGNSFSQSVLKFLPEVAEKEGESLDIANLMLSGCVLSRHASNIVAAAESADLAPYGFPRFCNGRKVVQKKTNIPQALAADRWDIVTIQQGSSQCFKADSYQPWGDEVVKAVRQYAPQAKILVQQTWTYNELDRTIHDPYTGGPGWFGIDRDTMYRNLTSNYFSFAKSYGFAVIPTGDAVELYRHRAKLARPEDDVVGVFPKPEKGWWDRIHLNDVGSRLQAYVWFRALFGRDPSAASATADARDPLLRDVARDVFSLPPLSLSPYPAHQSDYCWRTEYEGDAAALPSGGATPSEFRGTVKVRAGSGRATLACGTSSLALAADGMVTAKWTDADGAMQSREFPKAVAAGAEAELRLLRVNGGTALWHFILDGRILCRADSAAETADASGRFAKLGVITEGGASAGAVKLETPIVE